MDSPRAPASFPRLNAAQVIACGIVAASIGWSVWLLRDRPLNDEVELLPGTVLPSSEMAIVEAAFDRAQLTDHRTEDGRVWVPRPRQSAYMRALVDAEALPREFGSSLRRVLEKNSPWQSRAVQEELLRVAVQEELAHVICSMPGIERASVLYDVEERGGLGGGLAAGPVRTASVNIRTQPDTELEPVRVQAIRVLVAASIAGLSADRVAVTDLRSGVHYAGPLEAAGPAADAAGADPELARRIAHERHLAEKVRHALAFVKGAVVSVTVSLPPPGAAPPPAAVEPPRLRDAGLGWRQQRTADANAPAEVGRGVEATAQPDPAAVVPPAVSGPDSILVSVAIPDTALQAAARAAQEREPGLSATASEQREEARIREHVLQLLPATPVPEARRVVITVFPAAGPRAARRDAARATVPGAPTTATAASGRRTPGQLLDAAWIAVAGGRPGDVPREAWLIAIGIASTALAWLVLRAGSRPGRDDGRPRRRHPRIDWSRVDETAAPTDAAAPRRAAA
jgi:type III secretory pathway lipoprotein EscJ